MALAAATPPTAAPKALQESGAPPSGVPDFLASLRGVNSLSGLLEAANGAEEMVLDWVREHRAAPTPPPIRDVLAVSQTIRHLTSIKKTMLQVAAHPELFTPPKTPGGKSNLDEATRQRILAAIREVRGQNLAKALAKAIPTPPPDAPAPTWPEILRVINQAQSTDFGADDEQAPAQSSRSLRPEATCSSSLPSAPALSRVDEDDDEEENPELYAWPIDSILADPDDPDEDEDPEEDDLPQWRPSVFKDPKPTPAPSTLCGTAAPGCDSLGVMNILPVIPSVAPTPTSERGSLSALRTPHSELDIPAIPAINAVPVCPTLWKTARELMAAQTQSSATPFTPESAPSPTSTPTAPPESDSDSALRAPRSKLDTPPDPSASVSSPICPSSFVLPQKPPPT